MGSLLLVLRALACLRCQIRVWQLGMRGEVGSNHVVRCLLQKFKHPFENRSHLYRFGEGICSDGDATSDEDAASAHGWCADSRYCCISSRYLGFPFMHAACDAVPAVEGV